MWVCVGVGRHACVRTEEEGEGGEEEEDLVPALPAD